MKQITSKDGTTLACWHSDCGGVGLSRPHLLLIHGTAGDHATWTPLLTLLEPHFQVWTLDRRGRGCSGDNAVYSLQNEAEDIAAVIQAIGAKVHLFGHSFGALCALEAALLTENIATLMIYEPPLSLAGSGWSQELDQTMQTLLNTQQHEAALLLFFRDILKMPESELAMLQTSSSWSARTASAHTVHRELQLIDCYQFNADRFLSLQMPTLLLLGSESPPRRHAIANKLKNALSNSQLVLLEGQQHGAVRTAPKLLASKVFEFLSTE